MRANRILYGFSPFKTGMGDLCDPTDITCQQTGVTNLTDVNGSLIPTDVLNNQSSIPSWAWLVAGGVLLLAFFPKR